MQKKRELDPYLIPCINIISKWIKDLNARAKTIKFLEENIGVNLCDIGFSNRFLNMTPKAQATKENCTSSKLKTFVLQRTLSRK